MMRFRLMLICLIPWPICAHGGDWVSEIEKRCVVLGAAPQLDLASRELDASEDAYNCLHRGDSKACEVAYKIYIERSLVCDPSAIWALSELAELGKISVGAGIVDAADRLQVIAGILGVSKAQLRQGLRYYSGSELIRDPVAAFAWFHKAAEKGELIAQVIVARMLVLGEGIETDRIQGFAWACIVESRGARTYLERRPYGFLDEEARITKLAPEATHIARDTVKRHPYSVPTDEFSIVCR